MSPRLIVRDAENHDPGDEHVPPVNFLSLHPERDEWRCPMCGEYIEINRFRIQMPVVPLVALSAREEMESIDVCVDCVPSAQRVAVARRNRWASRVRMWFR